MTSTRFRFLRQQGRQVAEHALEAHVLRLAGRLNLAGIVVVEHTTRQSRDRDGRVPAFADVDDVAGVLGPRGGVASIGDQDAGDRRHLRHGDDRGDGEKRLTSRASEGRHGGRARRRDADREERRSRGRHEHHLLRALRAEPGDERQAR